MRRAVLTAAVVATLSACGGEAGGESAAPTVTVTATKTMTISTTVTVQATTPSPTTTAPAATSAPAATALGTAYRKAFPDDQDLTDDEILEAAQDKCAELEEAAASTVDEMARYMIEAEALWLDELVVYAKYSCPKHHKAAQRALTGFDDGTYEVVAKIPRGELGMVRPGKYRTGPRVRDCYWERSTGGGDTIANDFVTNASQGVTVTIRSSDGGFKSEGCGQWLPVS